MKLYYSATSPYARKVRILIIELGLEDRVELVSANPMEQGQVPGPLSKVPCLSLDNGDTLFDSPVICAYLEALATGELASATNWTLQRMQALADGVMDAAFSYVMEVRRPEERQSEYWKARWLTSIRNAVKEMALVSGSVENPFDTGRISMAAALGYLDFRIAHINWRSGVPDLNAWYEVVSRRRSMTLTEPAP